MTFIADQFIGDPPTQPQPIFLDELVAEMAERIADLTLVLAWTTIKSDHLPPIPAAAWQRLRDFAAKVGG